MDAFFGAGILFVSEDGRSVLSGYHPKLNRLSGFGGKCHEDEEPLETAVREIVEEIFGLFDISQECSLELSSCIRNIPKNNADYILYIESETRLFEMAYILQKNNYVSPYYLEFPKNSFELNNFRQQKEDMEITRIDYFFIRDLQDKRGLLTKEFYSDLQKYLLLSTPQEYTDELIMFSKMLENMDSI
jgi:hypothetical protein